MWVWVRLGSVNRGTGTYESWMLNTGRTVVQLHAAKQATTEIQCRGCVCPSSPLLLPSICKALHAQPVAQFLGSAGCWIVQIWCPVGEVAEWVNPECSSLHKLCWSVPPSQLIWCLPAKSSFRFDLYLWFVPLGKPHPKKTCIFGHCPNCNLTPPIAQIRALCGTKFLPKMRSS